jgi:hypothetical protein
MATQAGLTKDLRIRRHGCVRIVTGEAVQTPGTGTIGRSAGLIDEAGTERQSDRSEPDKRLILRDEFVGREVVGSAVAFAATVNGLHWRQL